MSTQYSANEFYKHFCLQDSRFYCIANNENVYCTKKIIEFKLSDKLNDVKECLRNEDASGNILGKYHIGMGSIFFTSESDYTFLIVKYPQFFN